MIRSNHALQDVPDVLDGDAAAAGASSVLHPRPGGRVQAPPAIPVRALRQEIAALQLHHALRLSQQQARALLPVLEGARSQVEAVRARRAAAEPALAAALTRTVDDLVLNEAISDATREALKAARLRTTGTLRRGLEPFWQAVDRVLTTEQLATLRSSKPGATPHARSVQANASPERGGSHPAGSSVVRTLTSGPFISLVKWRAE
jgi:hypothetical protein